MSTSTSTTQRRGTCRYCCGVPNPVAPGHGRMCLDCSRAISAYRQRAEAVLAQPKRQPPRAACPLVTEHTRTRRGL